MNKRVKVVESADVFLVLLREYEGLLQETTKAATTLEEMEAKLEAKRQDLMAIVVQPTRQPRPSIPVEAALGPFVRSKKPVGRPKKEKNNTAPTPKATKPWESRLLKQDPRVRRSLTELCEALADLGGRSHIANLAKKIGVTREAVAFRLARAKKLKVVTSRGKGVYALPKYSA
jgi:hypothetical protein